MARKWDFQFLTFCEIRRNGPNCLILGVLAQFQELCRLGPSVFAEYQFVGRRGKHDVEGSRAELSKIDPMNAHVVWMVSGLMLSRRHARRLIESPRTDLLLSRISRSYGV
jgi:hypothetical protein